MTEAHGRQFLRWLARTYKRVAVYLCRVDWLIIFTALLVFVGYLQYKTLDKTDETLRQQQRAWLAPQGLIPPENFMRKDNNYTEVNFRYENVGNSPAVRANIIVGRGIITLNEFKDKYGIAIKVRDLLNRRDCESIRPQSTGAAVFPKVKNSISIGFPAELVEKVNARGHYAIVVACIAYETMGEIHRSRFCNILEPIVAEANDPSKWRSSLCSIHNGAD